MNADAEFDALVWRDLGVAFDHRPLNFDGAADRIDDTAEFDDAAVASALDDAAVMDGDGRVDQIAPKGPKPCEDAIFVRASKPAVADDVGYQDRRQLPGLTQGASQFGPSRRSLRAASAKPLKQLSLTCFGMAAFPCCTDRRAATGNAGPAFGS